MLPIGGYLGNVPAPALATLQADINRSYAQVFELPLSPSSTDPRVGWIESHCSRIVRSANRRALPVADFICSSAA